MLDFDRSCNVSRVDHANSTSHGCNGHSRYDTVCDYNIPSKPFGYLALEATSFKFIGSDHPPVETDLISKCLQVADVILSTNKPIYCEARIPIVSGLNINAWENYLQDYPDDYYSMLSLASLC